MNDPGPVHAQVTGMVLLVLVVVAVKLIAFSLQTGLLEVSVGATGVESTFTTTAAACDLQELMVRVTR